HSTLPSHLLEDGGLGQLQVRLPVHGGHAAVHDAQAAPGHDLACATGVQQQGTQADHAGSHS
ncbi:hypothetical protein, partial [Citrobacter youngae]|uniref:hypothetical protein n=1 Tax=Citrobacter youngae TaxID=133448 RepID=UPI001954BF01